LPVAARKDAREGWHVPSRDGGCLCVNLSSELN